MVIPHVMPPLAGIAVPVAVVPVVVEMMIVVPVVPILANFLAMILPVATIGQPILQIIAPLGRRARWQLTGARTVDAGPIAKSR
jgi:hypothetical protein